MSGALTEDQLRDLRAAARIDRDAWDAVCAARAQPVPDPGRGRLLAALRRLTLPHHVDHTL